jgi:hypothetical protein
MPRRSANKVTIAAVSEAMPQQAPKKIRNENLNAIEKGRVATSRSTEHRLARPKRLALFVIIFINNITSSILTVTSHFQSGQVGGSEEGDFSDENCSHDTPPQVDEVVDPLFKPVFSLPTRDTVDSQTSGCRALDILYFFVLCGKEGEKKKRVCKICG